MMIVISDSQNCFGRNEVQHFLIRAQLLRKFGWKVWDQIVSQAILTSAEWLRLTPYDCEKQGDMTCLPRGFCTWILGVFCTWIFLFCEKMCAEIHQQKTYLYQCWQSLYISWSSRYTVTIGTHSINLSILSTLMKVKNFWLRGMQPRKNDYVLALNNPDSKQLLHQSWHRKSKH